MRRTQKKKTGQELLVLGALALGAYYVYKAGQASPQGSAAQAAAPLASLFNATSWLAAIL